MLISDYGLSAKKGVGDFSSLYSVSSREMNQPGLKKDSSDSIDSYVSFMR